MSDFFDREPIFWTSTKPGYNTKDRERVRNENGRRIVERIPQRGHQGDYENRRPAQGVRSVRVVCHDGNTVDSTLTSAAAHLDHTTPQGQYVMAKWRHFGWFPLGNCPLALLGVGQLQIGHFRDQSIVSESPCPPNSCNTANPCKHALAELAARRSAQRAEALEVESKYVDPTQKILDGQRDNTAELGKIISQAIRAANGGTGPWSPEVEIVTEAEPSKPDPGKPSKPKKE